MELQLKSKRYAQLSDLQKQLLDKMLSFGETKSLTAEDHQTLAQAMGFQNISPTKLANALCVIFDVKTPTNNSYLKALTHILDSLYEETIDYSALEDAYTLIKDKNNHAER